MSLPHTQSKKCTAADMLLRLSPAKRRAGNVYYSMTFINRSELSCSMHGFPGVSLMAGDGTRIGTPATREGGKETELTLLPGRRAYTVIHTLAEEIARWCWPRAEFVVAYPPDSATMTTTKADGLRICGGTFTVTSLKQAPTPRHASDETWAERRILPQGLGKVVA
nr:DUF4232 domain-containing protein [Streptomyces noursei]